MAHRPGAPTAHRHLLPLGTRVSAKLDGYERSREWDTDAVSRGQSNGAAGWTGDLSGASMRTVSMRVVIVPPRFEGLPTASSQTVPMNGCFSLILTWGEGRNVLNSPRRAVAMGMRGRGIPGAETEPNHSANGRPEMSLKSPTTPTVRTNGASRSQARVVLR